MVQPPATAQLIASASRPLSLRSYLLCTADETINLAAVAVATNKHFELGSARTRKTTGTSTALLPQQAKLRVRYTTQSPTHCAIFIRFHSHPARFNEDFHDKARCRYGTF